MPRRSWDRRPKETDRQYYCFSVYLGNEAMQGIRSLKLIAEELGVSPQQISKLMKQCDWHKRAADFDAHVKQQYDNDVAKAVAKWRQARLKEADRAFANIDLLHRKINHMAKWPLKEETREVRDDDGRLVTIITRSPAKWQLRDMALFMEQAKETMAYAYNLIKSCSSVVDSDAKPEDRLTSGDAAVAIRAILENRALPGKADGGRGSDE